MKKMPVHLDAIDPSTRIKDRKIPYTIMQTMKTRKVPKRMYRVATEWVKLNPEYDYEFFSDKRCRNFIKQYFSKDVLISFNMLNVGAAKGDLFRWCYLYIKGCVYLDIDMEHRNKNILNDINSFIKSSDTFVSYNSFTRVYRINHAFIASQKGHPLLKLAIDHAVNNIKLFYKYKMNVQSPQSVCGPTVIGMTLNLMLKRNIRTHLLTNIKNNEHIVDNNIKIKFIPTKIRRNHIISKYKGYTNDYKKSGNVRYGRRSKPAFSYKYAHHIKSTKYPKANFEPTHSQIVSDIRM